MLRVLFCDKEERKTLKAEKRSIRKEGERIRNIDPIHFAMANLYKKRCDSEVYFSQCFDIGAVNAYLQKKNEGNPDYHYSLFQVVAAVLCKVLVLRPQMNRFIRGGEYYQRNGITISFTAKKTFSDTGGEEVISIHPSSSDNMDTVHSLISQHVSSARDENAKRNSTTGAVTLMTQMPHFISKSIYAFVRLLGRCGLVPYSLRKDDSNYSSCMLANLGSIHLPCGYHHLNEWGNCSMMCIIGEKKKVPQLELDESVTVHDVVELGLTLDERIADGYYYSKTLCLIRKLFENPELLDLPFDAEVDY